MLDEIVDLLVETVCSARKTIRIAGTITPAELVKSKLMKLNSSHIEFVLTVSANKPRKYGTSKIPAGGFCSTPQAPSTAITRAWWPMT